MKSFSRQTVWEYVPPLVMLILSLIFLVWSYSYDARSQQVPVLVGWILLILCVLDLISTSNGSLGNAIRSIFTGQIVGEASVEASQYPLRKTIIAMLWPAAFVVSVILIGFIPSVPIYVFLFVVFQGRKPFRQAAYAAILSTIFMYLVFEQFLRYEVYRGIVFIE